METPSSNRRITRSQALASLNSGAASNNIASSKKHDDSEKGMSKSRQRNAGVAKQRDRSALIDITNDSPIVGLAKGTIGTPLTSVSKKSRTRCNNTPGSGEALLRGQVKNLLQKVEEDAEFPKYSLDSKCLYRNLREFLSSPGGLLAPTPANTPQILNFSSACDDEESVGFGSVFPIEDQLKFSKVVNDIFDGKDASQNSAESEKSMITRTLLFDFSDKSEGPDSSNSSDCSSVLTYQSKEVTKSFNEDDDSSVWSIQVNASIRDEEDEDDEITEVGDAEPREELVQSEDDDYYFDEEEGSGENSVLLEKLCDGMNEMYVDADKEVEDVIIMGKHTRFMYDSDDEIVEEEEDCEAATAASSDLLRLKGLPTPKGGKHLRWITEEESP